MGEADRAPEKAPHGSPCNGCGYCCAAEPCEIAVEMLGATAGPCPAMEFDAGRFWCGLIRHPSRHMGLPTDFADEVLGRIIAAALGAGRGCDADDFDVIERLPSDRREGR